MRGPGKHRGVMRGRDDSDRGTVRGLRRHSEDMRDRDDSDRGTMRGLRKHSEDTRDPHNSDGVTARGCGAGPACRGRAVPAGGRRVRGAGAGLSGTCAPRAGRRRRPEGGEGEVRAGPAPPPRPGHLRRERAGEPPLYPGPCRGGPLAGAAPRLRAPPWPLPWGGMGPAGGSRLRRAGAWGAGGSRTRCAHLAVGTCTQVLAPCESGSALLQ